LAFNIPDGFLNLKDYCFYAEKKPGYGLILYTANVLPGKRESTPAGIRGALAAGTHK
jgi:hypothetical protein